MRTIPAEKLAVEARGFAAFNASSSSNGDRPSGQTFTTTSLSLSARSGFALLKNQG